MELKRALTAEWFTPQYVIDLVLDLWPEISLDPCGAAESSVPARVTLTERDDGLHESWHYPLRFGEPTRIYINPPYNQRWLDYVEDKCEFERDKNHAEILLLVPVKSDQAWFQRALTHATAVCFIRGRVKFGTAGVGAAFSSCLFYWGAEAQRFTEVFTALGAVLLLGGEK